MIGVWHEWGGDLLLGSGGDLALAQDTMLVRQRLLRRLLTNPTEYLWHLDYGGGLGSFVGQPASSGQLESVIRAQMFREPAVRHSPGPTVDIEASGGATNTLTAEIRYAEVGSSEPQVLRFDLPRGVS